MDLHERDEGEVAVLDLSGELRGGPADESLFKGTIARLLERGTRKILLNFSEVKWINSTGLGFIVAAYTDISKLKGTLKMCSPNERIMNIFTTTRFNLVIGISETEEEALAAFEE